MAEPASTDSNAQPRQEPLSPQPPSPKFNLCMSLVQTPDFHLLVAGQPEINTLVEAVYPWWRYTLGSGSELAVLLLAVLWHTQPHQKKSLLLLCPQPLSLL